MSFAKRAIAATVTVAALSSLTASVWPPARSHTPEAGQNELASQGAGSQDIEAENRRASDAVAADAERDDAATAAEHDAPDAAEDLIRSLLRP